MKQLNLESEIWTVRELCAHLNIARVTAYDMLKRGELPGFRIGEDWRFQRDEIERWQRERTEHESYAPRSIRLRPGRRPGRPRRAAKDEGSALTLANLYDPREKR